MRFPKAIRHRKAEATIYGKTGSYPFYRVAVRVDGQRQMKSFRSYSEAKHWAEDQVREIAKGSRVAALTPKQASDALAALERLQGYFQSTGQRVTLLTAVVGFCESSAKLGKHSLPSAVDGFLANVATVHRKDIAEAVAEFIASRKHLTEAKDGRRAQLSPVYARNVGMWLNEFSGTFPGTAVCELTKENLTLYISAFPKLSPKSRNDRRTVVKMFLSWCVRRDYLAQTHRLFEADRFKELEKVEGGEIDHYRPEELGAMLAAADDDFVPVLALGGLAGLRVEEIMRLNWSDVWRVEGHIEITAQKAKTRQRRLVEAGTALVAWLAPYRKMTGPVWAAGADAYKNTLTALRDDLEIPARRNGFRHAFCTYHYAMHSNENLTAAQAGNTPAMIHSHYKGLATKAEATKWFEVLPEGAAGNIVSIGKRAK